MRKTTATLAFLGSLGAFTGLGLVWLLLGTAEPGPAPAAAPVGAQGTGEAAGPTRGAPPPAERQAPTGWVLKLRVDQKYEDADFSATINGRAVAEASPNSAGILRLLAPFDPVVEPVETLHLVVRSAQGTFEVIAGPEFFVNTRSAGGVIDLRELFAEASRD